MRRADPAGSQPPMDWCSVFQNPNPAGTPHRGFFSGPSETIAMRIGVPKETKTLEGRVALVPAAAGDLVNRGHEVWLEKDAGNKSGFTDEQYTRLGVKIAPDAATLYEKDRKSTRLNSSH